MSFKDSDIDNETEIETDMEEYERLFKERRVLYYDENIDSELIEKINFKLYTKKEERFKYLDRIFNPNKYNKPSMREIVERNIDDYYKNNFEKIKKLKVKNPKISFEEAILRIEKKTSRYYENEDLVTFFNKHNESQKFKYFSPTQPLLPHKRNSFKIKY